MEGPTFTDLTDYHSLWAAYKAFAFRNLDRFIAFLLQIIVAILVIPGAVLFFFLGLAIQFRFYWNKERLDSTDARSLVNTSCRNQDLTKRPQKYFDRNDIKGLALSKLATPTPDTRPDTRGHAAYDVNVSKFLLCLCSLVYETETQVEKTLSEWDLDDLVGIPVEANGPHPSFTMTLHSTKDTTAWLFYSQKMKFIVLAFKGTSPLNLTEWLSDASLDRVRARNFPAGSVHEGFFSMLWSINDLDSTDAMTVCNNANGASAVNSDAIVNSLPNQGNTHAHGTLRAHHRETTLWGAIQDKIRELVEDMREDSPNCTPNLYVTGHSLGAGVTTLAVSGLMASPLKDAKGQPLVALKAGYAFASPRCGDDKWTDSFNTHLTCTGTSFFRIKNGIDVVTTLPTGFKSATRWTSPFNYRHVGQLVHIGAPSHHAMPDCPDVVRKYASDVLYRAWQQAKLFVQTGNYVVAPFAWPMTAMVDHFPYFYMESLLKDEKHHQHTSTMEYSQQSVHDTVSRYPVSGAY
eukprot:CAMPEP_0184648808 /NCGR_PEP_ID=MMETSP0308-20130426/6030_1 /TAXON_ID=38269 /ORGANISM="Gloeochaete witrockiana, Strain SAG 46.84" /LENGTH=517 /DNA_ID=CAMNT_0027081009 /DNA_START=153 /DNA_END=1706 /DNA_ORIENTATION=-